MSLFGSKSSKSSETMDGISAEDFRDLLQNEGYKAKLETMSNGKPRIQSSSEGLNFYIYFYGAQNNGGRATSIQFNMGSKISWDRRRALDKLNDWNSTKRFLKCYTDEDGDLWADYDFHTVGVTRAYIVVQIDWWCELLRDLRSHVSS